MLLITWSFAARMLLSRPVAPWPWVYSSKINVPAENREVVASFEPILVA